MQKNQSTYAIKKKVQKNQNTTAQHQGPECTERP